MLGGRDGAVEHTGPRLARPMVKAEIMSRMGEQHLFRHFKEDAHWTIYSSWFFHQTLQAATMTFCVGIAATLAMHCAGRDLSDLSLEKYLRSMS